MKNYTKNTSSRKDICYSIGKKEQYYFAQRLLASRGLEDTIEVKIRETASMISKVFVSKFFEKYFVCLRAENDSLPCKQKPIFRIF